VNAYKYLNLGCGDHFKPDWVNIDAHTIGEGVIIHDLTRGIPFPDASFDLVYHSHLLEHFPEEYAPIFIRDCYRVLKPGAIHRVVVPDLENLARSYLLALLKALKGETGWEDNYDWILLEMYDQTVRARTGGAMVRYLSMHDVSTSDFIMKRLGKDTKDLFNRLNAIDSVEKTAKDRNGSGWLRRICLFFKSPHLPRDLLAKILLGSEYKTLQLGRFHLSGEKHHWMYDRFSLARLLTRCGFKKIIRRTAVESYVNNWACNNLDTQADGSIYKPDSLYMEAIKP
jgi:predicted SAM-dependent methyltransferase